MNLEFGRFTSQEKFSSNTLQLMGVLLTQKSSKGREKNYRFRL